MYLRWLFSMKKPLYIIFWNPRIIYKDWHNNIGDDLNVYLLSAFTKKFIFSVQWSIGSSSRNCYSVIGSLLPWWINSNTEMWGSGISDVNNLFAKKPKHVYAVRGPRTRKELLKNGIDCPAVYGDPALLLPIIYSPTDVRKEYKCGIILNEKDYENVSLVKRIQDSEYHLIDICHYQSWKDVVREILRCECICSSSLHGLILADAYRIPNIWCRFLWDFGTGYVKFYDYFESVGRRNEELVVINEISEIETCMHTHNHNVLAKIDIMPLIDSCPFKNSINDYMKDYMSLHSNDDIIYMR